MDKENIMGKCHSCDQYKKLITKVDGLYYCWDCDAHVSITLDKYSYIGWSHIKRMISFNMDEFDEQTIYCCWLDLKEKDNYYSVNKEDLKQITCFIGSGCGKEYQFKWFEFKNKTTSELITIMKEKLQTILIFS